MTHPDPKRPSLEVHCRVLEEHGKTVFREYFKAPNGVISDWLLFGGAKTPVIVFPLDEQSQVIALKHFRYGVSDVVLELPGGAIESQQTPVQAVIAELEQEAGYSIRKNDIIPLYKQDDRSGIWFDPASCRVRFLPYLARNCQSTPDKKKPDPEEQITCGHYSLKQWFKLLANGNIRDSKTIAVSLLAIHALTGKDQKDAIDGLK